MTLSNVQLPAQTESFEAATTRHRARIEAVPAEDIQYVYADPLTVVRTVLNAEKRYMAFRPRMASLNGEVDLEQVDQCASYGRAYWYFSSRVVNVPSEPGFDKAAAHAEGLKLRDLLATVRSSLGKAHITSGVAHMRPLAGSVGHDNVASDLVMHLAFFTDHWAELEGKVPITRADLGRAEALANALVADDPKPSPLAEGSPQLLAYQAGTLFLRAYAEVRRAIVFLRGRQGDADEIAPPVYSGRTPPKRADKPAPEQPSAQQLTAPAEHAPAPTPAQPETLGGLKGSRPFVV